MSRLTDRKDLGNINVLLFTKDVFTESNNLMELLQTVKDKVNSVYSTNPKGLKILGGAVGLYTGYKFYQKWKYSTKIFNTLSETENKVILITGCDTGFGNQIALKLSIELGYRVIATCLKQESVDKFLSNQAFTENKSTSIVLDVTKLDNIEAAKDFTIKYLKDTKSILWGLVNNAGFAIPGSFELVPKEFDNLQRDVLLNGPLNIIRTFLPLIHGRKEYKQKFNINNGGRIVNIASCYAKMIGDTRYGVCKTAICYLSHSLRQELSPRFGIWCCSIEPGGYNTGIWKTALDWGQRIKDHLQKNNQSELLDVYEFDIDKMRMMIDKVPDITHNKFDTVVDDVIHGLTSKYPQRDYKPGWNLIIACCSYGPYWVNENLNPFN